MIWYGEDEIQYDEHEPAWRSCWECNSAHEHLKMTKVLHNCFLCGRFWVKGIYMDTLAESENPEKAFADFFTGLGLKPGESTFILND